MPKWYNHCPLRQIASFLFFFLVEAAQLKSKLWPHGPTLQIACVLNAWTLISIRFICPLLPYFSTIALALCSLGQRYLCWIGCSGNPYSSSSLMFTCATIVFKFQLWVRARSLSEACQSQTLVEKEKSSVRLSDAPHRPSSLRQSHPSLLLGDFFRQLGVNRMAISATMSGPLGTRNLYNLGNLWAPVWWPLILSKCNRHSNWTKGFWQFVVHCGGDVSWTELACCWRASAAFTYTQGRNKA